MEAQHNLEGVAFLVNWGSIHPIAHSLAFATKLSFGAARVISSHTARPAAHLPLHPGPIF